MKNKIGWNIKYVLEFEFSLFKSVGMFKVVLKIWHLEYNLKYKRMQIENLI